jgi:hypothetical protein
MKGLRTSNGRVLDHRDVRRIVLGVFSGDGIVTVSRFEAGRATALLAASATAGKVLDFGKGRLPLAYEPNRPTQFEDQDEIRVEGVVEAQGSMGVVLRVDDGQSTDYASRFNDERTLPPGPFSITVGMKGLRTSNGRVLDHRDVRRIVLGVFSGGGIVTASRFEAGPAATLPPGVKGYSLGARDATMPAGFERIAPGDVRLEGHNIQIVRRPRPDPLIANGLNGVERLRLRHPAGRVRVTLWTEDPGEWEMLPHPLERGIRVNGHDALSFRMTAEQWIKHRYLRGLNVEHSSTDDAWTAYGRWRGNERTTEVNVGNDGIVIELSGRGPDALFLAAVLVEPVGSNSGFAQVQEMRASWYRTNFPVAKPAEDRGPSIPVRLSWGSGDGAPAGPLRMTAAPDTGTRIRLAVTSDLPLASPKISIEAPSRDSRALEAKVWAAEKRLELGDGVLMLGDNRLIADLAGRTIDQYEARIYEIWVAVPANANAGIYRGGIYFSNGESQRFVPIETEVLPVKLPQPQKPSGFYLAEAPHLSFFPSLIMERQKQVGCDLALMKSFGLTGTAPPAAIPRRGDYGAFLSDMLQALQNGVRPGWLVYNPAQHILEREGVQSGAELIASVSSALAAKGVPQPVWSVADEPSNPGEGNGHLHEWIQALRAHAPSIKLAAQLNSRADERLVPLFDTVIINDGFGLDAAIIERAAGSGRQVWLYNTNMPRLTAGLWLWGTAAQRYVQWHGRMPTADPFDPLDGREGDFQMIYPGFEVCPPQPDIHRNLLEMAEGVVDQRWLLWLQAQRASEARRLLIELKGKIGASWSRAKQFSTADIDHIRAAIINEFRRTRY